MRSPMRGAELMNALCAAAAEGSVPVAPIGGKTDEVLSRLKRFWAAVRSSTVGTR